MKWFAPLGDGAIKGFVFPQIGANRVLVSTMGSVWSVEDLGFSYDVNWQVTSADVPSPSTPVYVPAAAPGSRGW